MPCSPFPRAAAVPLRLPSRVQAVGLAWDVRLPTEAQKRKLLKSASGKPSGAVAPSNGTPVQAEARPDVAMAH